LNDTVPTLPLPDGVQVLHLTGAGRDDAVRDAWARSGTRAVVAGFLDAMQDAYRAADVVVCRSGAITVAELAVAGLPSVLVPLMTLARGDQEANARVLERAGGARVVMQNDPAFADKLGPAIAEVLTDAAVREAMRAGARSVARPDAAQRLADVVEELL
jgi:UDP-N-acetylglucosamine:LPS N-acetylglucosamine transferase